MKSFFHRLFSAFRRVEVAGDSRESWSRRDFLLKGVVKTEPGLEIAPFFSPIASKAEGFCVETLDVLSRPQLVSKLLGESSIPDALAARIEDVDHIGSASELKAVVSSKGLKSYKYILSSHNFEHLPNPIRFLRDCESLLGEDGQLCMAIPDLRCCFDRFRMPTELDVWLKSFYENKLVPSAYDRFRAWYKRCNNINRLKHDQSEIVLHPNPRKELSSAHVELLDSLNNQKLPYQDCHVSAFTPSSFRLLIKECVALRLFSLDVVESTPTIGNEFLVRLKKVSPPVPLTNEQRRDLYFNLLAELAESSVVE